MTSTCSIRKLFPIPLILASTLTLVLVGCPETGDDDTASPTVPAETATPTLETGTPEPDMNTPTPAPSVSPVPTPTPTAPSPTPLEATSTPPPSTPTPEPTPFPPIDADGDGFPETTDCDDTNPDIHPYATESCDDIDQDCDGESRDPDSQDATAWFLDSDSDGFGSTADSMTSCDPIDGYADNADDCDDTNPDIHPHATESCDDIDQDCDGESRDPDSQDATVWFLDSDSDGFGSAADSMTSCDPIDGYADNADDCDDTNFTVFPGAPEDGGSGTQAGDNLDNDCDGYVDEGLLFGAGKDEKLVVEDVTNLADVGATCVPVMTVEVSGVTVSDPAPFAPGDKVLLVNLQGNGEEVSHVGSWEIHDVSSVSADTVAFVEPVVESFGETGNDDLSGQAVALFRLPQFVSVTVRGRLTAPPFDGACGGMVAFVSSGSVVVSGAVDASALGYPGGEQNVIFDTTGQAGTSITGEGSKTNLANAGGGGGGGWPDSDCYNCEGTGGGGGHGSAGESGEQANPTYGDAGRGGGTYGTADLSRLTLGSGGGAGAVDSPNEGGIGGAGGTGGGAILIIAPSIEITGTIMSDGEDGEVGCAKNSDWCGTGGVEGGSNDNSEAEPGGGGAGGSIYLITRDLVAADASIRATGGSGQESGSSWARWSGDGGDGRIRLDFDTINGIAQGNGDAETTANAVADPDPGFLAVPDRP